MREFLKLIIIALLTCTIIDAIAVALDPMISAHVWCAITQSDRCF